MGTNHKPVISTWLTNDDFNNGSAVTDKDGKWSINNAPAAVDGKEFDFRLTCTQKDYTTDSRWSELQEAQNVTLPRFGW